MYKYRSYGPNKSGQIHTLKQAHPQAHMQAQIVKLSPLYRKRARQKPLPVNFIGIQFKCLSISERTTEEKCTFQFSLFQSIMHHIRPCRKIG